MSSSSPSHKRARTEEAAAPAALAATAASSPLNRMHQDNRYAHYTPDFAALAKQYPDTFGPLCVRACVCPALLRPSCVSCNASLPLCRRPVAYPSPLHTHKPDTASGTLTMSRPRPSSTGATRRRRGRSPPRCSATTSGWPGTSPWSGSARPCPTASTTSAGSATCSSWAALTWMTRRVRETVYTCYACRDPLVWLTCVWAFVRARRSSVSRHSSARPGHRHGRLRHLSLARRAGLRLVLPRYRHRRVRVVAHACRQAGRQACACIDRFFPILILN